jgi:pimeloyl-ACP methyl ester carboxylesterase
VATNGVELDVLEAGEASNPLVVLSHGFPESSWSWRHQLPALAAAGYHAVAPDQRGYGRSSRPGEVSAYGIDHLCDDLLGLLDGEGREQAVFVGHDWGALIVWELARLHPERVKAVVGVSVPFVQWPGPPTALMRAVWGDRFFYILYFQPVGPAETELGADPRRTMARVLWSASGDGFQGPRAEIPPMEGTGFLDLMSDPPYRNLDANYERIKDLPASRLSMPSFFIGGDKDGVIAMDPGGIDRMREALPDFRGAVLLPGVGHWTQQEAPAAFNDALLGFLRSL